MTGRISLEIDGKLDLTWSMNFENEKRVDVFLSSFQTCFVFSFFAFFFLDPSAKEPVPAAFADGPDVADEEEEAEDVAAEAVA